ncbi:MAG: dethiobiotin synthase [Bacteroidales bacterium]|nr:dethiobiotin synthase [Bacteroidales bacterium]
MGKSFFITGIDTDAGKTYCTAWLAKKLADQGQRVITMKFIQTGCVGHSEDIDKHRELLGTGPLPEDKEGLTAPIIFSYPASAQLAARIDGKQIDFTVIDSARAELERRYDAVLVEGAGGLMVPITDDVCTIDYVESRKLPAWLVTNSHLGSINHTLLSLEALEHRGIELEGVLYNQYYDTDPEISADTRGYIERYLMKKWPKSQIFDVPRL